MAFKSKPAGCLPWSRQLADRDHIIKVRENTNPALQPRSSLKVVVVLKHLEEVSSSQVTGKVLDKQLTG